MTLYLIFSLFWYISFLMFCIWTYCKKQKNTSIIYQRKIVFPCRTRKRMHREERKLGSQTPRDELASIKRVRESGARNWKWSVCCLIYVRLDLLSIGMHKPKQKDTVLYLDVFGFFRQIWNVFFFSIITPQIVKEFYGQPQRQANFGREARQKNYTQIMIILFISI